MINKRISKITMLTCLMLGGIINAQEFYTCVPKKSWWINTIKESVPNNTLDEDKLATAITKGVKEANKKEWKTIIDLKISSSLSQFKGFLRPGNYKVTAAGAGGAETIKEFTVTKTSEFLACVGAAGGSGGGNLLACGGGGGGGGGRGYNGYYSGGGGGGGCKSSTSIINGNGLTGGNGGQKGGGGGNGGYGGIGGNGGSENNAGTTGSYNITNGQAGDNKVTKGYGSSYGSGSDGGQHGTTGMETRGGSGYGGKGCGGGGGGGGGNGSFHGGGGGGGGSYFKVADVELVLKGGDGNSINGAGPDGYVIIERFE